MPFMPEMLAMCGQTVNVVARADRTCDTVNHAAQRRLRGFVHLGDLRCNGAAHGGCQAECLLFWHESWLEGADGPRVRASAADTTRGGISPSALSDAVRAGTDDRSVDGIIYRCQATEIVRASDRLPWWQPGQYVRDVRGGNAGVGAVIGGIVRYLGVKFRQKILRAGTVPGVRGTLEKTPRSDLALQAGERVRVRSRAEIEATLDRSNKTRGLTFDSEMLRYCDTEQVVLRRVERIVEENSGLLTELKGDCILLDGAVCRADYHRLCPRAIYPWWRENWLERTADGAAANRPEAVAPRPLG
jgi:hypothetical protein